MEGEEGKKRGKEGRERGRGGKRKDQLCPLPFNPDYAGDCFPSTGDRLVVAVGLLGSKNPAGCGF